MEVNKSLDKRECILLNYLFIRIRNLSDLPGEIDRSLLWVWFGRLSINFCNPDLHSMVKI